MDQNDLTALISQTAQLMEQFERRCDHLGERMQGLMQDMQGLTTQLPLIVGQSADASMRMLPGRVVQEAREGLEQVARNYQQRLHASGEEVSGATLALATRIRQLEQLHRHLLWKTVGATVCCLVLLLAGGVWLSMHYRKVIAQNQLSAQLMKAYNEADVNLCDGRLCANIDTKAGRFGEHRQYVPVMAR